MVRHRIRSTPDVLVVEKKLWSGCGGSIHENSMPNFELRLCPGHWGSLFDPKLCKPSSYVISTWFALVIHMSNTFAQLTPSGNLDPTTVTKTEQRHFTPDLCSSVSHLPQL